MPDLNESKGKEWGEHVEPAVTAHPEPGHKRALWVAWWMLLSALIAVVGYGYFSLRGANIQLSQLPGILKSTDDLSGRLADAEARLKAWADDSHGLKDRVVKLERRTTANLQLAEKRAEDLTSQLQERVMQRMDERDAKVDSRFSNLESSQAADQERLARLDQGLASLRQEVAAVRQGTETDMAGLQQRIDGNQSELGTLARRLDRQRVDFELPTDREAELVPGILVTVTKADVKYQGFQGWVRLLPEGQTLWLGWRSIEQPVVFYRQKDTASCELVATRVAKHSVVGYLLLPADSSPQVPLARTAAPTQGSGF